MATTCLYTKWSDNKRKYVIAEKSSIFFFKVWKCLARPSKSFNQPAMYKSFQSGICKALLGGKVCALVDEVGGDLGGGVHAAHPAGAGLAGVHHQRHVGQRVPGIIIKILENMTCHG